MPDFSRSHFLPDEDLSKRLARDILAGWAGSAPDDTDPDWIAPSEMPLAFRRLLDQPRGMTAVLTEHWGGDVQLRVRRQALSPDGRSLARHIALLAGPRGDPVELAGIRIALDAFAPALRDRVRQGLEPFGRLLHTSGITFHVEVLGLLRLSARGEWASEGKVPEGTPLYGRLGRLRRRDTGQCIAETVELLPRTRLSPVI